VVAGGPDFIMSILGTASVQPGRVCDRVGTSEGVNLCWSAPVRDPRLLCFPHVVRGAYNVAAMMSSSGASLEWASRSLSEKPGDVDALLREVQAVAAGAGGLLFLPFLAAERFPVWDPRTRGAFVGLALEHGRREMARAVVESTGYAVRTVLAAMESAGCQPTELRVAGGQARSAAWCQVRADVTGRKVLVPEQDEPDLVGGACVALAGLEDFESPAAAAESLVRIEKTYAPDAGRAGVYAELFTAFTRACACLGSTFT
jgi:xylulokinase